MDETKNLAAMTIPELEALRSQYYSEYMFEECKDSGWNGDVSARARNRMFDIKAEIKARRDGPSMT